MLTFSIIFALLAACFATPVPEASSRQKRWDAYDSYPSYYPYGFGGYGFAPRTGAFAGTVAGGVGGVGNFPFYQPFPYGGYGGFPFNYYNPFEWTAWIPRMDQFDWTKGPNVCVEKKEFGFPKELADWLQDGSFNSGDFNSQSKTCKGDNNEYKCYEKSMSNGEQKMVGTKYFCCHGFVRDQNGAPGCVEKPEEQISSDPVYTESQPEPSKKPFDKFRYSISRSKGGAKSFAATSSSPVEGVQPE